MDSKMESTMSPQQALELELQQLGQLCLPGWDKRTKSYRRENLALRPERPEYTMLIPCEGPCRPQSRWTQALQHIQTALSQGKLTLDSFLQSTGGTPKKSVKTALSSTAAVLYDQECQGDPGSRAPPPAGGLYEDGDNLVDFAPMLASLVEHMLLVDYGVGQSPLRRPHHISAGDFRRRYRPGLSRTCRELAEHAELCRDGELPNAAEWAGLDRRLRAYRRAGLDTADAALVMYYYHTHRREITASEYDRGLTGYTGVVEEMVEEMARRGPDRLVRKLSVDINILIPRYVTSSKKRQVLLIFAMGLAAKHGITTLVLPKKGLADLKLRKPLIDMTHKDGVLQKARKPPRFKEIEKLQERENLKQTKKPEEPEETEKFEEAAKPEDPGALSETDSDEDEKTDMCVLYHPHMSFPHMADTARQPGLLQTRPPAQAGSRIGAYGSRSGRVPSFSMPSGL